MKKTVISIAAALLAVFGIVYMFTRENRSVCVLDNLKFGTSVSSVERKYGKDGVKTENAESVYTGLRYKNADFCGLKADINFEFVNDKLNSVAITAEGDSAAVKKAYVEQCERIKGIRKVKSVCETDGGSEYLLDYGATGTSWNLVRSDNSLTIQIDCAF